MVCFIYPENRPLLVLSFTGVVPVVATCAHHGYQLPASSPQLITPQFYDLYLVIPLASVFMCVGGVLSIYIWFDYYGTYGVGYDCQS